MHSFPNSSVGVASFYTHMVLYPLLFGGGVVGSSSFTLRLFYTTVLLRKKKGKNILQMKNVEYRGSIKVAKRQDEDDACDAV